MIFVRSWDSEGLGRTRKDSEGLGRGSKHVKIGVLTLDIPGRLQVKEWWSIRSKLQQSVQCQGNATNKVYTCFSILWGMLKNCVLVCPDFQTILTRVKNVWFCEQKRRRSQLRWTKENKCKNATNKLIQCLTEPNILELKDNGANCKPWNLNSLKEKGITSTTLARHCAKCECHCILQHTAAASPDCSSVSAVSLELRSSACSRGRRLELSWHCHGIVMCTFSTLMYIVYIVYLVYLTWWSFPGILRFSIELVI